MQVFRQNYYQQYSSNSISRGRSLTPPSFKQNSSINHLRSQDFYYPHPSIYSDPAYYRTYGDPYIMQRLPPPAFLPPTSLSRSYRDTYSSSSMDRMSTFQHHKRSRSRSRRRYELRLLLSLSFFIIKNRFIHRTTNIFFSHIIVSTID